MLKRLVSQTLDCTEPLGDYIFNIDNLLKLANACAEYGSLQYKKELQENQCATGEWLNYPEYEPEEQKYYLIYIKDEEYAGFHTSKGEDFYWYDSIKRFAEINP